MTDFVFWVTSLQMYVGNVLLLIKNYVLDGSVKVIYSEKVTKLSTVDLTVTVTT